MSLPMADPAAVAELFDGSVLAGLPVVEDVGGAFVVDDIDPERMLPSWRAARATVAATGRWPVMIGPEEVYLDPTPDELTALHQAATHDDPWLVFNHDHLDGPVAEWEWNHLRSLLGDALADRARHDLPASVVDSVLDRWIYDRMLDDPALVARVLRVVGDHAGTHCWYRPQPGQVQLALLPTTAPWLAPAWLQYHGAGDHHRRRALAAALHEWHRRYGAELVAWWGTMLQFVVARPPAAGDPAWEVAGQLKAVGGSLQMRQWSLALAVDHSDAWFLHDRP